jgi:hypothetical protein
MPAGFKDKNFQLAVLDELRGNDEWLEEVEEEYLAEKAKHADWPTWDEIEENEFEELPGLMDFFVGLPLPADQLAGIESLVLDGDREVYSWIFPNWHDTDDYFVIADLSGIEQCAALEELDLGQGMVQGCSLRPLAKLQKLRKLSFCATGNHKDVEALLDSPSLRELSVFNDDQNHADWPTWKAVAEKLAAR